MVWNWLLFPINFLIPVPIFGNSRQRVNILIWGHLLLLCPLHPPSHPSSPLFIHSICWIMPPYISPLQRTYVTPPPLPSIPLDKTGHTVAIMGVDQPGPLLTCSIHRLKLSHSCSPSTSQSCMSSLLLVHISPKISKSMQHSDGTWGNWGWILKDLFGKISARIVFRYFKSSQNRRLQWFFSDFVGLQVSKMRGCRRLPGVQLQTRQLTAHKLGEQSTNTQIHES